MERQTQKLFNCETCKKNFKFEKSLRAHKRLHSDTKSWKCLLCDSTFRNSYKLRLHQINQHSTTYNSFQCQFCNKKFVWKSTLDEHQLTHITKGKPFKCDICQHGFKSKLALSRHYRHMHDPNPPVILECLFCRKICPARSHLEAHLATHIMETAYFCKICSSEFNAGRSLQRHMETHKSNREKRFQCALCTRAFYTKGEMQQHMVTHTGEKVFKCKICRKDFTRNGSLKDHLSVHTDAKNFQCDTCGLAFKSRPGYYRHKKMHLSETIKPNAANVPTLPTNP